MRSCTRIIADTLGQIQLGKSFNSCTAFTLYSIFPGTLYLNTVLIRKPIIYMNTYIKQMMDQGCSLQDDQRKKVHHQAP